MSEKRKKPTKPAPVKTGQKKAGAPAVKGLWKFYLPVMAITFLLFLPALQNGFTNWDDILYVTQNPLLRNLSGDGIKAIFNTPVVSNYHPLTILSLAFNYQVAELSPMSWHLTSMILHTVNTGLVFWWIYLMSNRNAWVSAAVALLFGIHPMHVESVAWISERKDLLYAMFYIGALITYYKYVTYKKNSWLISTTVLGAISLLCKPAAIVLPLSLLCMDFYLKRTWSTKWILEKIPLFALSAVMAYVTVVIQSKRAIASVEAHNIMERFLYAGFGWVYYIVKAVAPVSLSGFHPFPTEVNWMYYAATILAIAFLIYLILKVRNRLVLFGFAFYTVNLLLVLQVVSIGNAVVAERYTYVPYIGLFFMAAMWIYKLVQGSMSKMKPVVLGAASLGIIFLGFVTLERIPVWKSSQTLWENVLKQYPDSPRAWTNKGLDYFDQHEWADAIFHLSKALQVDSTYANALEWRARTSLEVGEYDRALTDALRFDRLYPQKETGLFLLARSYAGKGEAERAIELYTQLINQYDGPDYYNNRGTLLFNKMQRYAEAKADFEKAISLNDMNGSYYLNLSRCYYVQQDMGSARKYGMKAKELGTVADPNYAKALGIE